MALDNIKGFVRVSPELATAGQPGAAQLRQLAEAGFEVVVNLGLLDSRYCLADEAGTVRELGMSYAHIPVDFQAPQLEDLKQFLALMDASRGKRVFVHCAANYRVSCFVGVYGQQRLGWSVDEAEVHMRRIWEPNETWRTFIEAARQALGIPG